MIVMSPFERLSEPSDDNYAVSLRFVSDESEISGQECQLSNALQSQVMIKMRCHKGFSDQIL